MSHGAGAQFIEQTKYKHAEPSDQEKGLPQPPLAWGDEGLATVELPSPDDLRFGDVSLREVVTRRTSLRTYADEPLSLDELSFLLWATQGVRKVVPGRATFRTVPSAGARHAFETHMSVQRVSGLEPGLYRYGAIDHRLIVCPAEDGLADRLAAACLGQAMVAQSAVTFVWVADRARMSWRYGERGMRYLHLDAGHVCQNLYLAAEAIGAGTCALAAFDDDAVNRLLGMDGVDRFAVYVAPVGKRKND